MADSDYSNPYYGSPRRASTAPASQADHYPRNLESPRNDGTSRSATFPRNEYDNEYPQSYSPQPSSIVKRGDLGPVSNSVAVDRYRPRNAERNYTPRDEYRESNYESDDEEDTSGKRSVKSNARSDRVRREGPPKSPFSPLSPLAQHPMLTAAAGAALVTAADMYLVEKRQKKGSGNPKTRSRSKSMVRRIADIAAGGVAGYGVSKLVDSKLPKRPQAMRRSSSLNDLHGKGSGRRQRADSDDSENEGAHDKHKGRGIPGALDKDTLRSGHKKMSHFADIAAEGLAGGGVGALLGSHDDKGKPEENNPRNDRGRSSRRDYDSDDSDSSRERDRRAQRRPPPTGSRRVRSVDAHDPYRREGSRRERGRDDHRDYPPEDSYDSESSRERRRRRRKRKDEAGDKDDQNDRSKEAKGGKNLIEEAIGLLGIAQGLTGGHRKTAMAQTAIGAYGLAQKWAQRRQQAKQEQG